MIFFVWSLVCSAVNYSRRQRMAAVLARWSGRSTLTFRRLISGRPGLSKMVSEPLLASHSSLLYRTEAFEVTCSVCQPELNDSSDWCLTGVHPPESPEDESQIESHNLYFIGHISQAAQPPSADAVEISNMCPCIAMRKDPGLEVLFCCNRDDFLTIACLWSQSLLRYKQIFEVDSLETVAISKDFAQALVNTHTPRTPMAALEKLCLDDIVAARHISDNVSAGFPGASSELGSTASSGPSTPVKPKDFPLIPEPELPNHMKYSIPRVELTSLEQKYSPTSEKMPKHRSVSVTRRESGLSALDEDSELITNADSVTTRGSLAESLTARSMLVLREEDGTNRSRRLSPTASTPLQKMLAKRRFSAAIPHLEVTEPSSRRSSLCSIGASTSPRSQQNLLKTGGLRRFSRRRATSVCGLPQKPPNVLIYSGESQKIYDRLSTIVESSLPPDSYTVYRLLAQNLLKDPWTDQTACLIIAETESLDEAAWTVLQNYFQKGGRMLFVCQNRLLANLTDCKSSRKRSTMLKMALGMNNNNVAPLDKEFEHFLKRLCKQLKNKKLHETHTTKDLASGHFYSIVAVRDENSPLLLYMQNSHLQAGALFTDATVDAILAPNSPLIAEALERLDMGVKQTDIEDSTKLSPGYLFLSDEISEERAERFLNVGELKGNLNIRFSYGLADNTTEPTDQFLPVFMDFKEHVHFNTKEYFNFLQTKSLGHALLFVPVITSTMDVMQSCVNGLPQEDGIVVVARHQTKGKGRGGNKWLSPAGCAMFSFSLRISIHSNIGKAAGFLQHLLALAVVDGICSLPGYQDFPVRIKWPNDIYYSRTHKMGGILVTCTVTGSTLVCTLGCGVNVANSHPTVCLNDMLPDDLVPLTPEQVIGATLTKFEELVELFQKKGSPWITPIYYNYWLHKEEVTIAETGEKAIIKSLDDHGYLKVRNLRTNNVFSLHPDGNSFDMMKNLIRAK